MSTKKSSYLDHELKPYIIDILNNNNNNNNSNYHDIDNIISLLPKKYERQKQNILYKSVERCIYFIIL